MAHTGKIGRLPGAVRTELNRRMNDGERTEPLLAWLNGLPEVQQVLAKMFGGKPISQQNLSQWRRGGFREWQRQLESLKAIPEVVADMNEWKLPQGQSLKDVMTTWMAANLLVTTRQAVYEMPDDLKKLQILRRLCRDAVNFQRGEHRSTQLKFDHQYMAFEQQVRRQSIEKLMEESKPDQSKTK